MAKATASPAEIIGAILQGTAADLLWFGGIGTYVRASGETNQEVGDRANDAIRINAADLKVKVVGEGANLGMTQRARIEFDLLGGACNSDAIDNSGGVNSSDVEVNIKIALASAMRKGTLTRPARNRLLAEMTEEVAALVLTNNYDQTLAISLARKRGLAALPHQARFMADLEERGLLDRQVETLPSPQALAERQLRGEALTRAELGVLLAYAKIVLAADLLHSSLPDETHFERDLLGYFPRRMAKKYQAEISGHRLRREIIARVVTNNVVDRAGPSFVRRLQDSSGRPAADVVRAFTVVRDGFGLAAVYRDIDALDNKVDGTAQLDFYQTCGRLIGVATAWFLKNDLRDLALDVRIVELRDARKVLEPQIGVLLPDFVRGRLADRQAAFQQAGAPQPLAEQLTALTIAELLPDIALIARQADADAIAAAKAFFAVGEAFRISRIEDGARAITPADYYDGLALVRGQRCHRHGPPPGRGGGADQPSRRRRAGRRVAGCGRRADRDARERLQAITEGAELTVSRLTVAAGLLSDLAARA